MGKTTSTILGDGSGITGVGGGAAVTGGTIGSGTIDSNSAYDWTSNSSTFPSIIISSTATPILTSTIVDFYLNGAYGVFVSGKYAYVTSNSRDSLAIIDVSNPASPSLISTITSSQLGDANGIFVSGRYAYTVNRSSDSIAILDVSDSASPSLTGTCHPFYNTTGTVLDGAYGVYVAGKYAYVVNNSADSLAIIDVSNPTNPTLTSTIQPDGVNGQLDGARHVFVSGKYAYVTSYTRDSLAIIDVSDPASPTLTSTITSGQLDGIMGVFVSGKYVYTTNYGSESIAIIDVSDPASPSLTGTCHPFYNTTGTVLDGATGIFVSGKYAYVTNTIADSLAVIDVSDPASPTLTSTIQPDGVNGQLDGATGIFVSGKYAYVTNYSAESLAIIEVPSADTPNIDTGNVKANTANFSEYTQMKDANIHDSMTVGRQALFQGDVSAKRFVQSGTINAFGTTSTALSYYGGTFPSAPTITAQILGTSTASIGVAISAVSASSFTAQGSAAGTLSWMAHVG